MNFKDIPKFIYGGSYVVNAPFEIIPRMIDEYVKDGLIIEPDFQRAHVWNDNQRSAFFEFLLKKGEGSNEIKFNCPNWSCGKRVGDFVLVDGLQRLTACLKFLDNKIPAFGLLYNEFEGKIDFLTGLVFRINELSTRKEVLEWYLQINTGGTVHTDDELNKVRELLICE